MGVNPQRPFSFTSLSLYEQCPRAFMYGYCMKPTPPSQENAFAQYGTLGHELLEAVYKGEMFECDLADEWSRRYPTAIKDPFPLSADTSKRYYYAGLRYFTDFKLPDPDRYEILAVEEVYTGNLRGFPFKGIADLLLRDMDTKQLILTDHKSKSVTSVKKDYEKCFIQMHLYAEMIRQKYGQYPSELRLNCFKEETMFTEPFDIAFHQKALEWAVDLATQITFATEFPMKEDWYFCNRICNHRDYCHQQQVLENGHPFGIDI